MKNRYQGFVLVIMLSGTLLITSACSGNTTQAELPPISANQISGVSLWNRITEESQYQSWDQWPGHEGIRPGQSPHGSTHQVFVNRTLKSALPADNNRAPNGSIIVKDNFNAGGKLDSITVMSKVAGSFPEGNDWFWAKYSPDGQVLVEGTPNGCVSCHSGMKDNDYVIIRSLSKPF